MISFLISAFKSSIFSQEQYLVAFLVVFLFWLLTKATAINTLYFIYDVYTLYLTSFLRDRKFLTLPEKLKSRVILFFLQFKYLSEYIPLSWAGFKANVFSYEVLIQGTQRAELKHKQEYICDKLCDKYWFHTLRISLQTKLHHLSKTAITLRHKYLKPQVIFIQSFHYTLGICWFVLLFVVSLLVLTK